MKQEEDLNIFIVNQNPKSGYDDKEGQRYNYPTSIPNGKQIKPGDILLFNLAKKQANKLNFGNKRITGVAKIEEIGIYSFKEKEMATAVYSWYKKFDPPLSFEEIGGDFRNNENNSMNKVASKERLKILLSIIKNKT